MAFKQFTSRIKDQQRLVEDKLLDKVKRLLAHLPFASDLVAAYYAVLDRDTSHGVRATLLAALTYFVLPIDIIPDVILGLGFTDDATVLYLALRAVAGAIKEEHRQAARDWLESAHRWLG